MIITERFVVKIGVMSNISLIKISKFKVEQANE